MRNRKVVESLTSGLKNRANFAAKLDTSRNRPATICTVAVLLHNFVPENLAATLQTEGLVIMRQP